VGFAMDKVVQEQISIQVFWLYHASYYPNTARYSTIYSFLLYLTTLSVIRSL
jgi:hypothetical protein